MCVCVSGGGPVSGGYSVTGSVWSSFDVPCSLLGTGIGVTTEDQTARRRIRPIRVLPEPVCVGSPTLIIQDASDLTGAVVRDCRFPLLHVSLRLKDIGMLPLRRLVASASCLPRRTLS